MVVKALFLSKAIQKLVHSSAKGTELTPLREGKANKAQLSWWKRTLQSGQRIGKTQSVGRDRLVDVQTSQRQTVRFTLQKVRATYMIRMVKFPKASDSKSSKRKSSKRKSLKRKSSKSRSSKSRSSKGKSSRTSR